MIAGVLGGVGEYLRIDPVVVRLVYLILTLFSHVIPALIVYLIAALIIPIYPSVIYTDAKVKKEEEKEETEGAYYEEEIIVEEVHNPRKKDPANDVTDFDEKDAQ
jgi:phage shock protein C